MKYFYTVDKVLNSVYVCVLNDNLKIAFTKLNTKYVPKDINNNKNK